MTAKKKTYVVTAAGYAGHKRGEEFDVALTEEQERRAVERGAIKPVEKRKEKEADG